MDVVLTFNISDKLLTECREIIGVNVSVDPEGNGDIQIVSTRYVPNQRTKMVQSIYGGIERLKLEKLPPDITVCTNPGAFKRSVSEHAFAMILSTIKKLNYHNIRTHRRIFKKEPEDTLYGKVIGILGYGGIGSQIARTAKVFGMKVIAYTRNQVEDPNVDSYAISIAKLISQSDILVILLPYTQKTKGLITTDALAMFNGNIIVNMSNADVVVKNDMLWYLKRYPEKYYLTDVWWGEPVIRDQIPDNCVLTPHIAGEVLSDFEDAVISACRNVKSYIDGDVRNAVDLTEYLM